MLERSGSVDHEPREGLREYGLAMEMELDMEKGLLERLQV